MAKAILLTLLGLSVILVLAGKNASALEIPNPLDPCRTLECVLLRIVKFLLDISVPLAAIMIIWAGFIFATSTGDPQKVEKGKRAIIWAVVGIAIILIHFGFADIIRSILGRQEQ
jgi:hypothetical protein